MKKIPLTQGKFALVDNNDYKRVNKYKWYYHKGYARRSLNKENRVIYLHRQILNDSNNKNPLDIDHINGNKLDNRKANLRFCTRGENLHNRPKFKNNKSGHKGVYWHKSNNGWSAQIRVNKKKIHLGTFENKDDAIKEYKKAKNKYYKE